MLCTEDVSRAELLSDSTASVGTASPEAWLLWHITLSKHNGSLSLVYGLCQNPTNNKLWVSPLGKVTGAC